MFSRILNIPNYEKFHKIFFVLIFCKVEVFYWHQNRQKVYLNKGQFALLYYKKNSEKMIRKFVDAGFVKTCDEFVTRRGYKTETFYQSWHLFQKIRRFTLNIIPYGQQGEFIFYLFSKTIVFFNYRFFFSAMARSIGPKLFWASPNCFGHLGQNAKDFLVRSKTNWTWLVLGIEAKFFQVSFVL